jgi:hypothetical protein
MKPGGNASTVHCHCIASASVSFVSPLRAHIPNSQPVRRIAVFTSAGSVAQASMIRARSASIAPLCTDATPDSTAIFATFVRLANTDVSRRSADADRVVNQLENGSRHVSGKRVPRVDEKPESVVDCTGCRHPALMSTTFDHEGA